MTRSREWLRPSSQIGIWLAVAGAASSLAPEALAQTESPSQTPPGVSAVPPTQNDAFVFPAPQGLAAPEHADQVHFNLTQIVVEGGYPGVSTADVPSGQVSVAEIYAYAQRLQAAYFDAGYPLARVIVPAQRLEDDGVVRLQVIDGYIEALDLDNVPEAARKRVRDVLAPLVGVRKSTSAAIERRLLLAGDTAGLTLRTTMIAGQSVGGTVLVLSGEHDRVNGVVAVDNRVSEEYGGYQAATSFALNSPFGGGEQFFFTFAGYPDGDMFGDEARRRYFAAGANAPIGRNGLTAHLNADYSTTRPGEALKALKLESEYEHFGAALSYPFLRSRVTNIVGRLALDAVHETQSTSITGPSVLLSEDELRVVRLGVDVSGAPRENMRGSLHVDYAQGLDGLGARTAADATPLVPLSRQGADADFSSLGAEASVDISVASGVNFFAGASAQYSFGDPLLRSEQFSPINANGLSGPPPSSVVGDNGAAVRVELQGILRAENALAIPYIFGAAAHVTLEQPTALELERTDVSVFGGGVRIQAAPDQTGRSAWNASVELSMLDSNDANLDAFWVTAGIAVRF